VKALTKPSLLVIDEAAKRGETEWENRLLFEILNKRYGDFKDTILIANQSREEFSKSMGPAIVRRMDEVGGLMVFE
jgi:DNA replication protein DnaC